jgi:hypothetical protein
MENPETIDPIYSDLENERKIAQAAADAEQKKIQELSGKLKAMEPRSTEKSQSLREISKHQHLLTTYKQQAEYFEIRRDQRKDFARDQYLRAFEAEKPWPNPEEFAEYKKIKQLRGASRSWDDRVPKTDRYNRKTADSGGKKEKSSSEAAPPAH